ncbi:SCO family protein [Mesorhizobium sp. BAC0120]|uniref:SCO family protein n=1 Tax=Mesorhizobium sp. BAC0120 TaxID=3090670 RepID=UPI00298C7964|nr:SCO family protein [Mesorhizobium sp. BAC0120]MDW6023550.1 SCO family protein [Mesorhizobium sp. BAC0120]
MKRLVLILIVILAAWPAFAFNPFVEAGIDQHPGAQVPFDIVFRDEQGHPVTLRSLGQGRPIVLAPVLHNCPNICGITLSGLVQAVQTQSFLPGRDFVIVSFGIDPKEGPTEARKSMADLEKAFPSLPTDGIRALTGAAPDIKAVTQVLGYRYAWDEGIGQYAHIAAVAVLTPDGRLARWLYGVAPEPADLKLALTEAGEGRLGTWGDQLLLLCYHYDARTGRYDSMVNWLLRIGGGVTVALGAGLIGIALLRERRRGSPP